MDPSTLTNTLTPLGEQMSLASCRAQRADPVKWHLEYWLHLAVVAVYKGQNNLLTFARIDREHCIYENAPVRDSVRNRWFQFQAENKENFQRYWDVVTTNSPQAQPFLRDLTRMLVNKGLKMREYLERLEETMMMRLRSLDFGGARQRFEKLVAIYENLREEALDEQAGAAVVAEMRTRQAISRARLEAEAALAAAAAAARDQLPNAMTGAQPQGGGSNAPAPAVNDPHHTQPAGETTPAPTLNGFGIHGHTPQEHADIRAGDHPPAPTVNGFGIHGQTPEEHGDT